MRAESSIPSVSVIIPALNEERFIGRCLESFARQDFPGDSFEVIVADNGSADRTIEIARSFSRALDLAVVNGPGVSIARLRNIGASRARGLVLAFIDADCVASERWLRAAATVADRKDIGILGAYHEIPEGSTWVARAWFGHMGAEKRGDIAWVPSGNMAIRRAAFDQIGGFDESLRTNEDCELCQRARSAGLRVVCEEAMAAVHLGTPQTLAHFYRQNHWHATNGLTVFLRNLPRITYPRPLLYASYTLACSAGVLAGIGQFLHSGALSLGALSMVALVGPAFLLSARLALRRGRGASVIPLTLLHLVFGVARAHALLRAASRARKI